MVQNSPWGFSFIFQIWSIIYIKGSRKTDCYWGQDVTTSRQRVNGRSTFSPFAGSLIFIIIYFETKNKGDNVTIMR